MHRFQGGNFRQNLALAKKSEELAAAKGCTPSQLALAWVLDQGDDIVPIPGTKRVNYLDDNLGAVNVSLTANDLAQIDAILPAGVVAGAPNKPQANQTIYPRPVSPPPGHTPPPSPKTKPPTDLIPL